MRCIAILIILALLSNTGYACSMWASISSQIPGGQIMGDLLTRPKALITSSNFNGNGWGLAYFNQGNSIPVVQRGKPPAYMDPMYDSAVVQAAAAKPCVMIGHVRFASSGIYGIPNPHPFERTGNGRHWLLAHTGTIKKEKLLAIIRPEFFAANPPFHGTAINSWIDSDLYSILMMQCLEDNGYQVKKAIGSAIQQLKSTEPVDRGQYNMIFSDGTTLWVFRWGDHIWYKHNTQDSAYSAVCIRPTDPNDESWIHIKDGELVTFRQDAAPEVENIDKYFGQSGTGGSLSRLIFNHDIEAWPNPFSSSVTFTLKGWGISFKLFDVKGCLLEVFNPSFSAQGKNIFTLQPNRLQPGIYILSGESNGQRLTKRLTKQ
jgi:predicted glutamine amidotransferase